MSEGSNGEITSPINETEQLSSETGEVSSLAEVTTADAQPSVATATPVEVEELSDAQIEQIHNVLDTFLAAQSNDSYIDNGTTRLPQAVRTALRKRMPREALERIASNMPVIDEAGNMQLVKMHAVRVQAVVVDYLADKIFGDRLDTKILERGVTLNKEVIMTPDAGGEPQSVHQVIAWAHVRCSVRLDNGEKWSKEDFATAGETVPKGCNTLRAHRIAETGSVTAARRRSLQQFGPVFGGLDVRDIEDMIGTIRKKQAEQLTEQQKAEVLDRAKTAAKALVKEPIAADPQIAQTDNAVEIVGKPAASVVANPAKTPAAAKRPANNAVGFRFQSDAEGELVFIVDIEIYASKFLKTIKEAKTIEQLTRLIALNHEQLQAIAANGKHAKFAEKIANAHEVRSIFFADRAKRQEERAEKAAKTAAKNSKKQQVQAKEQAVDTAVRQATANPATTETAPAEAIATEDVLQPAAEAQSKPEPAVEQSLSQPSIADTVDVAGFGGPSKPVEPAEDDEPTPEPEKSHWQPQLIKLIPGEKGAKPANLSEFGYAALQAVRSAPTEADVERILEILADELAQVPPATSRFLGDAADLRRKEFAQKASSTS